MDVALNDILLLIVQLCVYRDDAVMYINTQETRKKV